MERKLRHEGKAKKLWRAALFASTGLSAVVSLPAIVRAQTAISADTTPQGGVVVGGSASIAQAPASTTVNQSSERAAINWQSFDVGSGAKVQFNQPDQNAIALNRVVGGNLSQINGQINANGQIVLINQSGVIFGKGSQINAENIVVSTSDISTKDFMAGNMAFTGAPNPGAKIINQGNITVKDTGLVGLIAPQVENDGVITARLGQVILAGASAFTLDMYGDKLISLDVTKAVQAVDVGGKLVPALVTNRGVILADGGKVLLTAQDADALVTQLIDAGGTIRANSVGGQTGTISLQGVGGNINIAGNLLAKGTTGSAGGAIEALTTGTIAVASTADIDASGDAGGGVIAIGTDLARAEQGKSDITAPKAAAVDIAAGATLAADATGNGNGGTVALLSGKNTEFDGLISVRGGPNGGNGGSAEISSDGVISLSGTVLATAINGKPGEILLDPATLVVSNGVNNANTTNSTLVGETGGPPSSTVNNGALDLLSGNVTLEAGSFITVANAISMASATALSLISEGSIVVSASIQVNGSLEIDAATSLAIGAGLTASNILLTSGAAGTDINGGVTAAGGTVALDSGGTVFEGSAGSIVASALVSAGSIGGDASLAGGNTITTLDGFTLGGSLDLVDAGALTVGGSVSALNISLSAASLTFESGVHTGILALTSAGTIFQGAGTIAANTLTGTGDTLISLTKTNAIGTLGAVSVSSGNLDFNDASTLVVGGSLSATNINLSAAGIAFDGNANAAGLFVLDSSGNVSESLLAPVGTIGAGTLAGSIGGNANLDGNNLIGTLGNFTASTANLNLNDAENLIIAGTVDVAAPGNYFLVGGQSGGPGVTESSTGAIHSSGFSTGGATIAGDILLTGSNTIANIQNVVATGTFALNDTASLTTGGSVTAPDITLAADGINFGSLVSASGTLALGGSSITQSGGTITAGDLVSIGTIGGNVSLVSENNAIGTLGNFTLGGNLDLNDSTELHILGTVATPESITLAATAGGFDEPGGIDAATLSSGGVIVGNVIGAHLTGTNEIGTLGNFTVTNGGFQLNDGESLIIAGTVDVPAAPFVYFGDGVTETSTGAIIATGFNTSGVTVSGDVLLTGSNTISAINVPVAATGTFALDDTTGLSVFSKITAADVTIASPTLALAVSNLTIAATASTPSLVLATNNITTNDATDRFRAGNGTIQITPFSGDTTIDIGAVSSANTLGLPGSIISALDPTAATYIFGSGPVGTRASGIDIDTGVSFASTATVDLSTSGTIFDNSGNLTTGTLFFSATGGVTQTNGAGILANLVAGTAASGNVLLGSDANTIVSLGSVSVGSGGTLALVDAGTLTIAGAIDPAVVTLYGSMGLVIDNDVSASSQVSLGSGGDVVQTAGSITTPTLASIGSIGGNATLTSATNSIGTISGFTLGGTLDLANAGSLAVGTVDAGNITLSAGGIGFTGAVTSSNVLVLASSGDITQTGGSITAGTLVSIGTIGGNALFNSTTNSIGKLGGFLAANTLSVFDSIALATEGTVAAPTVSLDAAGITFNGTVAAPTELALGGTGNIQEQSAGAISTGSLVSIGTIAGGLILGQSGSATVSAIGNLSLTSEFYLHNATSADITGVLSAPGQIVAFLGKGVTETGTGAIDAGEFNLGLAQISGDVLLTGTNAIGSIANPGDVASGIFDFNDTIPLRISGGVAGADVTIAAPALDLATGNINANGATAPQLVLATNTLSIDQTNNFLVASGGTIAIAPYSAGTAIDIGSASSAGTLGIAGSIISVLDTTASEIIIGKAPIGTQASAIGIDNSPSFGGTTIVDLSTSGLITQNAGTFSAATLEFDSAGFTQNSGAVIDAATLAGDGTPITGSVLLVGANTVSTLDGISLSTGTFALVDTGSLDSVGSLSAPIVTLSADTLGLNGTISAPTLLALGGTGSITETGSISTGTLTSLGSIGGDATLTGTNAIGTLGGFTLGGTLDLADSSSLAVAGTVDGSYITLSAPGIGFTGNVTSSNELALESTGSITQSAGSLSAGDLVSIGTIGGNVSLGNTANSFGDIGDFASAGTIDLAAGTLASSDGATISAPVVSLSAASFDLAGLVNAPTKLAIGGGETGNAADLFNVYAGSLVSIGTIEGGVNLGFEDPSTVAAIGNFSLTGNFFLPNAISAQLTGLLSTPDGTVEYDGGGITETSAGAIDASHFNTNFSSVGPITGDVLLTGSNTISSIDSFGVGASGTVALNNTVSLAVDGGVTGTDVTIAAPTIGLNNALDSTLAGGTIAVATDALTIGSGGSFVTDDGTIALAPQTPGYGIDIGADIPNDLDITGALSTAFPAGTEEIIIGRALGSLASNIAIDQPVSFASTILQLSASGAINDYNYIFANTLAFDSGGFYAGGGAVHATLLEGDGNPITGAVALVGPNNSIATLGSIDTGNFDFSLKDTAALGVTGPVSAADIFLTDSNAGGINVGGSLVASSGGTIGLVSDALSETAGTIMAPNGLVSLSPYTIGNSIDLGGTGGDLNLSSGFIDLISSKMLQIGTAGGGAIIQDNAVSVASPTLVLAGSSIDFAGTLAVPTLLTFASAGDVSEDAAATISVPALTGTAGGTIGLVGGNSIGTLDALSAGGNITVNNVPSIIIAGLVSGSAITLDDESNVTEIAGGGLSAGALGGSIGGNAFLTTGNTIGELNDLTVDGLLLFNNAGGGPLDLGNITTGNASFSADGITIVGLLDIGGGADNLGLFSTGGITEASAAGIIEAGALYGTDSGGQVSLGSANTIASLGSFAAGANNFSLNNAISLDIAGQVSVATGNYLALTGTSLTESTGIVDAGTLVGSFANGVSLAAANSIGTLGAFTLSAGTLTLDDTGLLNITGPVNAPSGTLVAQTMAIAGTITTTDALALESAGNVYETTGFISTPSLTTGGGTIGGFASFGNSNSISNLGSFVVDGNLTLVDGGSLSVSGPVIAANATLSAAGIGINGGIGTGILDLASSLGITETGIIHAATLTGTSAETVALLDANTITTLGGFSVTSGNFGISNTSVLEIAGLVTAPGTITLEGAGATEIAGGTLASTILDSGGTALLGSVILGGTANDIGTLGGFTLAAGTLVLADAGSPSLDLGGIVVAPTTTLTANTIGGTGTLFGTEATLSAGSIDIGGLLSLTSDLALESSGSISESTGVIVTPTLTSGGTSITGNVTLAGANTIGTLGGFVSGGTLDLADTGTLTITGPVASPTATITASSLTVAGTITGGTDTLSAGGIDVSGSISLTNLLALVSTGSITEPGGFITVPTLTSGGTAIGGNVMLADQNRIGTLAGFTVGSSGTLDLTDAGLLTIAGPVVTPFATLTADTISVTGAFSGTTATFAAGTGGIGVTGSISLATLLALASGGAVTESGAGVISAATLVSAGPSINGNVLLANTLNNISTLGGFTIGSGDTLVLEDAGLLTVEGPVIATYSTFYAGTLAIAGSLSGASETLTGGNILIEAAVSVANDLALETPGSVTESTGGTITAGTLTTGGTTIGGNAILASFNSIGTLGGITGFTLGGTLDLADAGSPTLAIAGNVVTPTSTITANTIVSLLGSSFSGTSATFSAGSIDIGGLVSLASDLALESTGNITEGTGTIDVPLLTSGGTTIGGDVALTNNTNNIGTLGGFTLAPGGSLSLALDDNGLLTLAGPVSAPDAVFSAGSISITGAISIAQTLALETDAGGVVESTGSIVAGTLTSGGTTIQGDVALGNGNDIATLSSFAASGFILLDNSPSLIIDGFVTTPGALTLAQTGPITEIAGGTLDVGTLSSGGVSTGNVALGNANTITTLGGFIVSSGDTLTLTDTGLLTIAGPVAAPFATLTSDTIAVTGGFSGTTATFAAGGGGIGVTGSISLATLLALASGGAVTESGAGVIAAGTLVSAGASINGNVLLANTLNNIGTLGGFTIGSGDTLVLDDSGLLTVIGPVIATYSTLYAGTLDIAGPISGASETLSGGNIDINAAVSITNDLALETPGSVTETPGGTITAGTLTTGGTTIGGNAVLASLNSIGTLGGISGFTVGGTLDLADTGTPTLAIAGNVVAANSTLTANTIASLLGSSFSGTSATFSAGSIDIGGLVSLTSELALASSGNITESTGTIDVPTLISAGAIGGSVSLTNNTNNIGTLGGFTVAGGALALDDNGLLTVAGPVAAPDAALSAGSISITGAISIAQTLALATSAGGVDESTGQITAAVLTTGATTIQGTVALINGNAINTLSNFAATGYIILDNTPNLTIDGYVATPQKLTLDESGSITEVPGGTLAVGTLSSGSATTGNVALGNANSIVTLGGFTVGAGDTLALNDTGLLTIAGPVAAPFATISSDAIAVTGSMTGGVATLSAGSIGIGGSIILTTLLALESSGDITEPGGFVTVPTLTSGGTNIGGNVTLGDANSIASLGSFTETGTLILTDAGALAVTGPVNTGNATLTADGIAVPGSIGTGTLALFSGSDITETGGAIQAALLIGTVSSGSATLQGTNTIATLGSFTVDAGTLALADTGLLTVTGPVAAPTTTLASNAIEVSGTMSGGAATLTAGSIDISGLITTTSNIALESAGNVTEANGGVMATPLLTSGGTTIGGNAALTGTANSIGTLGAFAAAGTLTLDDTGLLTVRGLVNAPITTLSSGSIAITGSINAATALALESTGNITEPGGFISTPTLTSGGTPVGGNVSLTDINAIGTLAAFTDDGTFTLDDSGLLTVAGPVVAPVVTLSSPTIAITGNIQAATLLALESTGNVFEGANGAINTGTLTSGAGGNVTLNTAFNSIATLGAFTAAGLALNDQTPLAITSPVSIANVLALLDTGNVTQTGGTITAGTLTSDNGTIGGAASFTQPGNDIPLLGAFGAVAGLALTDAVPLNLAGNIFTGTAPLTLLDAGNPITQTGGAISAGTLNATAGNVTLGQANAIGDLGNVNVSNLYVNGVAGIGGPVVAATFATILSPGALPVTGNINAGSNLLLEALGDISQTGGSITSGPAGSATFIAGGAINLSGAISVADQLDLVAGGDILHPAGHINAGTLAGAVGGYVTTALGTVMGNGSLANFYYSSLTTDFNTIGNFIMHDSTFALNNDGPLAIVGSLVADVILITTNGSLTLVGSSDGSGGGIFINSGSIAHTAYFSPHPTDSVITVNNGSLFQTGNFNINTANGPPGTLFLYVDNGAIQFAPAPDELFAPFINLEISDPGGVIAGNVDLDRLVILDAATKSVQLTGTLDGLQGQAAASKGIVDPFPRPEFQFNACPIGSVNCTILPIESLPPGNPLENFDLTQRKRKKLDKNVHLPGVATRDF